jgi:branched-chain amino acid transport system substrate-binding protein
MLKRLLRSVTLTAAFSAGYLCQAALADGQNGARFGALLPLTGNAALTGQYERQAIDLAVANVNAASGRTFTPIYEDMAANPRMAVPATEKLADVDQVPFSLIGYSSVTIAAAPIAERARLLLMNAGASSSRLAHVSPYVFNCIPLADIQVKVMLWHAAHELGLTKIALYYRNDDLGADVANAAKDYAGKIGATIVGEESFTPNAPDHKAQLAKIRFMQPQTVFVVGAGNETGIIVKQANEIGLHPQWISYSGYENGNTLTIGGKAAEGGLYTVASTTGPDGKPYPEAVRFYAAFEKTYGISQEKLDYTAAQFYEGAQIYMHAVDILLSQNKPVTGEQLRATLMEMPAFHSVFGEVRFRPDGTVLEPIAVKTVRTGRFDVVKVYTIDELQKLPE